MSKLINDIFARVVFTEEDRALHKNMYSQIKNFALEHNEAIPECAEKTLALRSLHSALMYFGAAIAKKEIYSTTQT